MSAATAKNDDLGEGVFFAREDCASLLIRFMILIVDFAVLLFGVVCIAVLAFLLEDNVNPKVVVFGSSAALAFVYLVIVESSIGTLGFAIAGVRIVNLKGTKPSFFRMTFRLLLWTFGPIHPIVDFFWISNDRHNQTLRDKLAGTYVVKKKAAPIGNGRIRAAHYFLLGFSLLVPEVQSR